MSSLSKFANQVADRKSGQRLFWDRAREDGAPFRGPNPPMLREDEYEQRAVRVGDYQNGWFDTREPVQNRAYLDVMDRCFGGWYRLIHVERFWQGTTMHYVEWAEIFMEDGARTPYNHGVMEMPHGPGNFLGHP